MQFVDIELLNTPPLIEYHGIINGVFKILGHTCGLNQCYTA